MADNAICRRVGRNGRIWRRIQVKSCDFEFSNWKRNSAGIVCSTWPSGAPPCGSQWSVWPCPVSVGFIWIEFEFLAANLKWVFILAANLKWVFILAGNLKRIFILAGKLKWIFGGKFEMNFRRGIWNDFSAGNLKWFFILREIWIEFEFLAGNLKWIFILAGNLKRKLFNGPQRSKLNEEGACGAVSRRQFHVGRCLALGAIQLISAIYGRKYQGNTGATVAAARGGPRRQNLEHANEAADNLSRGSWPLCNATGSPTGSASYSNDFRPSWASQNGSQLIQRRPLCSDANCPLPEVLQRTKKVLLLKKW